MLKEISKTGMIDISTGNHAFVGNDATRKSVPYSRGVRWIQIAVACMVSIAIAELLCTVSDYGSRWKALHLPGDAVQSEQQNLYLDRSLDEPWSKVSKVHRQTQLDRRIFI